jgi:hypothetical protein
MTLLRARDAASAATSLFQVHLVVEDFNITTTWFVLDVGQRPNLTFCFEFQLLVFNLQHRKYRCMQRGISDSNCVDSRRKELSKLTTDIRADVFTISHTSSYINLLTQMSEKHRITQLLFQQNALVY